MRVNTVHVAALIKKRLLHSVEAPLALLAVVHSGHDDGVCEVLHRIHLLVRILLAEARHPHVVPLAFLITAADTFVVETHVRLLPWLNFAFALIVSASLLILEVTVLRSCGEVARGAMTALSTVEVST